MIVRHDLFEIERIEQLLLIPDAPSHHRTTPPMFASKRRNHCSATASIDFCNKIGHEETFLWCSTDASTRDRKLSPLESALRLALFGCNSCFRLGDAREIDGNELRAGFIERYVHLRCNCTNNCNDDGPTNK